MSAEKFNAIVIGAGMGGLCAAARLVATGRRVLVLEKSAYMGGRCSHREREDCTVSTGAIMIPMGEHSAIREAFDAVGASMDMVETTGPMRYRLSHGDFDLPATKNGLLAIIEFALQGDAKKAAEIFEHFKKALGEAKPDERETFEDWLKRHTDNSEVKNLFQGFCAALMWTNLHEIPAAEFFRFLGKSSRGSRFGLAARGNGYLMESLAAAIEAHGGEIRRRTFCRKILVEEGRAVGVEIQSGEYGQEFLHAEYVLSNAGPRKTIALTGDNTLFEGPYREQLEAAPHEAPIIHYSFVCDEPLIEDFDGSLVFGNTSNLIYLEIPSIISPYLAPPGKFLHTVYGAPRDAAGSDLREVARNTLQELEDNFPGVVDKARFLVKARHSGQSPGMHRWPGFMMGVETPVQNLFNVGDGVTPPGTIGTEGAAASARCAVRKLVNKGTGPH